MPNLELADYELDIRSYHVGFRYEITFRFAHTRRLYRGEGTAPSPSQCFDAAMKYLTQMMREAIDIDTEAPLWSEASEYE
jgi:hypothetical protein